MGTYANQQAAGEGVFRARVVIEGWPYIPVDHGSLVRTLADGRQQFVGLDPTTLRLAARVDMAHAQIREQEMTLEIVVQDDLKALSAFFKQPTATTYLTADLTRSATTINVSDTSAFPSSGVVHIRTEAIAYSGKTSTSFTGCTRGYWDSIAQAHFTGDGERLAFPPVTNLPRSLYGRRVVVYLYGAADADDSSGTEKWRGIARSDVAHSQGIVSFSVLPLSALLEQQLGGDLEEPIPIRGIYYPSHFAFCVTLIRWDGASRGGSSAQTADGGNIIFSGFFADQSAHNEHLRDEIATLTAGWSWNEARITVQPLGPGAYEIVYRTGTATAYWVDVIGGSYIFDRESMTPTFGLSPVDHFERADGLIGQWTNEAGGIVRTLEAANQYRMVILADTPRAIAGRTFLDGHNPGAAVDTEAPDNDAKIFLGGSVVPSLNMQATLKARGDSEESRWLSIDAVDTADRAITLSDLQPTLLGPQTELRLLRQLARDVDVGELITVLVAGSPDVANAGAMPLLGVDDFLLTFTELRDAIADVALGATRTYVAQGAISLGELLEHELRLVGCYFALHSTGRLRIRRLGLALSTSEAVVSIDATTLKGDFPAIARTPDDLLAEVVVRTGWNPREQEHKGLDIRVRDTTSPTHLGGVLEIAPRSSAIAGFSGAGTLLEVHPEDARRLASGVLGIYGSEYSVVTIEAGLEIFHVELGATVLLTCPFIPNGNGTYGVSQKAYQVVGYDWVPFEGMGRLELQGHERRIAGYAPAFLIASQVNTSGNFWTLTISNPSSRYTTGDPTTWFSIDDQIRIVQRDTATPTRVSGSVAAVSATTIEVGLDGAWVPGANEWWIGYDRAPSVETGVLGGRRWAQTAFAFVAGTNRRIGFPGGGVDAYEFSP